VLPTSASLSLSPPPSPASSSPSPSVSPPHSAKPRPTASRTSRVPSKSPQATTKPAASLAAALKVNAWRGGYVATVRVVNTGKATATWKITVRQSDGRLGATWNAQGSQQGSSFVFAGGSLAPGASATFGYQAAGGRPSGCSVAGGTCRLS
jgi:cellulase/cellobiase CelA1